MKSLIDIVSSDLSGAEPAQHVNFGLWGFNYEIDLTNDEALALEAALAPYIKFAREVKPNAKKNSAPGAVVRKWAQENNVPVSARGRISREVFEHYQFAQVTANFDPDEAQDTVS